MQRQARSRRGRAGSVAHVRGGHAESHPGTPRLADLRESGSIEQDADTVLFLSRDPDEIQDEKSGSRQVILSVAKNRSGPTGDIDMLFVPTSTKFYEVGPRKESSDE
ncbi:DnaB-like helicase C-terminal domain-containing protein [Collinsella sp. AF38-3AC]|uniref:DnaB-like helicase C-terminal domain-containing protein n=1 Tax=Collinsella sp. AF38-3AC TaxID=2292015 RepID=UPI001314B981